MSILKVRKYRFQFCMFKQWSVIKLLKTKERGCHFDWRDDFCSCCYYSHAGGSFI